MSYRDLECKKIFPISIFKVNIEDNQELKSLLVPNIARNSHYLKIPGLWSTNNVKTSFAGEPKGMEILYDESPYQKMLIERYSLCMNKIFDRDYQISLGELWYNYYSDGEYQEQHDHLGTPLRPFHFSCIHFLSFKRGEHFPPQFVDPLAQLRNLSLELDRNGYGDLYVPDVDEGDLLVFPSYLQHSVLPCNKTDYPRITISFNFLVTKYGEDFR